nr:transmembrane protein 254-like [Pogona vitticeps]
MVHFKKVLCCFEGNSLWKSSGFFFLFCLLVAEINHPTCREVPGLLGHVTPLHRFPPPPKPLLSKEIHWLQPGKKDPFLTNPQQASWAVFAPTTIPYNCLGSLGSFTKSLVENHSLLLKTGYLIAWLIHIGEAFYALKLCKEKGITDGHIQFLWFVQTFAFGIASLSYLLSYTPQKKRQ